MPEGPGEGRGQGEKHVAENPKLFLVSLGRSTGEVLRLVAANLGQRPLALRMNGLALEPVEGVTE